AVGGTVAARTLVRETPTPGDTSATGTSLGELPFGDGVIRIAGALLPDPTEQNYHPFGLTSYALTYTGYQVFENLLVWQRPDGGGDPSSAPGRSGGHRRDGDRRPDRSA
ncbi:MAG TPA: hypothetical protein VM618_00645, partial [Acidimicrobiia bacterium]|nr:hypothetical protein [Acidimicrobiia bacterium]